MLPSSLCFKAMFILFLSFRGLQMPTPLRDIDPHFVIPLTDWFPSYLGAPRLTLGTGKFSLLTLANLLQAVVISGFQGVSFSAFLPHSAITKKLHLKSMVPRGHNHPPTPVAVLQYSACGTMVHAATQSLIKSSKFGFYSFFGRTCSLPVQKESPLLL